MATKAEDRCEERWGNDRLIWGVALGAGIGVSLGTAFGAAFGAIGVGIGVGVAVGAAIGILFAQTGIASDGNADGA